MKRFTFRILALFCSIAFGVWMMPTELKAQTDGARILTGSAQPPLPFNIISNAGFEDRTTSWSVTGGSFTTTTTFDNVGRGTRSASWTVPASVSGYVLQSSLVTIPAGLYGRSCVGSILYKGNAATNGTLVLEAFDGTTAYGTKALANASTYTLLRTDAFTCPSSGSLRLRIRMSGSSTSSPTAVYFDEAYNGDLESSGSSGGGSFDVSTGVQVTAGGVITTGSEIRKIIYVEGDPGAVTTDPTTPLSAGTTAGYERLIVGTSDTNTVTIPNSGNVRQGAAITLGEGDSIWYVWDDANSLWQAVAIFPADGLPAPSIVSITSADSPYTASWGTTILANATSGAISVTLPTAASNAGKLITVKKTDTSTNAVTVDGNGSQTVDLELTQSLLTVNDLIALESDGTNNKAVSVKYTPVTLVVTGGGDSVATSGTLDPVFDGESIDNYGITTVGSTTATIPRTGCYSVSFDGRTDGVAIPNLSSFMQLDLMVNAVAALRLTRQFYGTTSSVRRNFQGATSWCFTKSDTVSVQITSSNLSSGTTIEGFTLSLVENR